MAERRVMRQAETQEGKPRADDSQGSAGAIRSDNGPEFTAKAVREWLGKVGAKTLYIEPGSPW